MKYLALLVFISWSHLSSGQNDRVVDPDAQKILQQLEQNIEAQGHIHYTFQLGIYPPESDSIMQEGAYWQAGTSYHLELVDYVFLSNGISLWVVDKASREIQIHDYEEPDPAEVAHPQNLLKIHQNPNFRYRLVNDEIIEFLPMEKDFEYFRAVMKVSEGPEISSINVWSKDGYQYEVQMSETSDHMAPTEQTFTLAESDYPDYHIEDLRIN